MLWIGLTGGMGCGKSAALKIFEKMDFGVESADRIVSNLYAQSEVLEKICKELEITPSKSTDELKSSISKKVFNDPKSLKKLEAILHPMVRSMSEETRQNLKNQGKKISFYEVPLLFEKQLQNFFDKTLCIGADEKTQLARIRIRNPKWSEDEIKNRLKAQLLLDEKRKLADFYIDNSGSLQELEEKCSSLTKKLLASSQA